MKMNGTRIGRVRTRLLSAMLSLVMVLSLLPAAIVPASAASWMEPYLEKLVSWGVMRGDSTGDLHPDRTLTRGEFVVLVNRAFGYDDTSASVPFRDVKASDWYYDDINIGYTTGYFNGTSKTTASPKNSVTREQAAVLLARNLVLDDNPGASLDFTDSNSLSNYSRGLIRSSVVEGILSGYGDGSFRPKQSITRGQMAVLLVNAIGTPINKSGTQTLGGVYGNVTISTSGVTLKDTTIAGNLYITGGLGLGDVTLENVNVLGKIVVCGAGESEKGENSVILRGVTAPTLVLDNLANNKVSIRAEGSTKIDQTSIRTPSYVEDSTEDNYGFTSIKVEGEEGTTLSAAGNLKEIVTVSPKSTVTVAKGSVRALTVDEAAAGATVSVLGGAAVETLNLDTGTSVTGSGDVDQMNVNTTGTKADMLPDTIVVRPGIDATINGQKMDTTLAAESSADPRLLAGYPKITDLAPTSAKGLMRTNKAGTLYWALTSVTDGSVGEADLLKPSNNANIVKSGNLKAAASSTDYNAALSGLTPGGSYYFSVVLVDARDQRSPVKTVSFSTPDNTTPNFATGYPYMSKITSSSGEVTVMPTKTCRLYYALLPKNAAAPTAKDFKANAVSGNLGFGSRDVTKNVTDTFRANRDALEELVGYDLYLWLTDADGAQSSAVKKVSFTTIDGTPPTFVSGPTVNSIKETSVGMTAVLSEAGTIYWVAVKEGEEYPKPINGQTTKPELTSEAAKLQVANGMNALKSGNVNATANKDAAISITGLASETAYDVYYVAQDKAGNYSATVGKMTIHTLDTNPPTVTQEFTRTNDAAGVSPLADTDIRIVFSESVQGSDKNQKLLEIYQNSLATKDPSELAALLRSTIQLYSADVTPAKQVDERTTDDASNTTWVIDYRHAIVTSEDGKIVVTFKSETALKLKSGEKYYFKIQNIADTSNNKNIIKPNPTTLDTFTTVYAQVNLAATVSSGTDTDDNTVNFDMSFKVVPVSTKNAADNVQYDILFRTTSQVSFQLYTREGETGKWKKACDSNGNPYTASLNPYADTTIRGVSYTANFVPQKSDGTIAFEKLNQLTQNREFGVVFTSLSGSIEQTNWNSKVEMQVRVIAGSSYSNLSNLTKTDITNSDLTDYLVPTGSITEIGTPADYTMRCIFTDSTPPTFQSDFPKFDASDTSAVMNVQLSRSSGKIYYVVAPVETIRTILQNETDPITKSTWEAKLPEPITSNSSTDIHYIYTSTDTPTSSDIMNSSQYSSNSLIKTGNTKYYGSTTPITLTGLEPNTKYCVYFVLQGDSQNVYTHQPYVFRFETTEVSRPIITLDVANPSVQVSVDKDSEISYFLTPTANLPSAFKVAFNTCVIEPDNLPSALKANTYTVLDAMIGGSGVGSQSYFDQYASTTAKEQYARLIRNQKVDSTNVVLVKVENFSAAGSPNSVNCTQVMQPGTLYTFLAVGRTNSGSGDAFRAITPVRRPDADKPTVSSCRTSTYTELKSDTADAYNASYDGSVTVTFTKKLFLSITTDDNKQIFKRIYLSDISDAIDAGGISILAVATSNPAGIGTVNTVLSTDVQQCQTVTFKFSGIKVGTTINFVTDICDEYGNAHYNDPLTLTFTLPDAPNVNSTLYKPYFIVEQVNTWGGSNAS
ncbi:putative surface layer protein [Oscillibacter valericigenes Sjm18-20]|nr:putative surface layer protein [Oscillibacter valericigenes Sjm18-20]